ncbi:hypothetical protein [Streptomyces sp. NPDC093111]|uniref:hypothetical protein n=1 Tax=Streptomyces sp. NPDC093111 TaxID=3154978 RepID=UPI0034316AFD
MSFGGPQWPQQGPEQQQPYGQQPPPQAWQNGPQGGAQGPWQPGPQPQQVPQQVPQQPNPFPGAQQGHTPDWGALADASAARNKRRRGLLIGGGALAVVAVGAVVATSVVLTNKKNNEATNRPITATGSAAPSHSAGPAPTFSSVAPLPPPNPMDFLDDAKKDKAPLSAEGLFPGKKLTMSGRPYQKGATASTTNCAAVTQGRLGSVLKANGCTRVIRATYVRDGVAVTVGVAVFPTDDQALKAKKQASGGIAPLTGSGVGDFCHQTVCLRRTNAVGRYVYLTQTGFTSGKKVTTGDKPVFQAADDLGTFTFNQIYARGRAQASAAAGAPGE